mmetsp:Transcript_54190/g.117088  ORF Transcript_54190/g.117088 Transcript_54190/m.117088 type:complete len:270 (+) Transcript_54190:71-880(+)
MARELKHLAEAAERCELLGTWGSFGWWLQGFLGAASFSSLIVKRYTDEVRRPWKVWLFDTTKQVMQCILIHLVNMGLARGFDVWFDTDADSCNWYWVNFVLDCTVGVLILFMLLRSLQWLYRLQRINRPELARTGDYGVPPSSMIFARQLADWLAIAAVEKLILASFTVHFRGSLARIARALLGWLDGFPRLELFVVMVATPLVFNVFALWTADSFLQAQDGGQQRAGHLRQEVSPKQQEEDWEGLPCIVSFAEWKENSRAKVIGCGPA